MQITALGVNMGKTEQMVNFTATHLKKGDSVLYVTLEDLPTTIIKRVLGVMKTPPKHNQVNFDVVQPRVGITDKQAADQVLSYICEKANDLKFFDVVVLDVNFASRPAWMNLAMELEQVFGHVVYATNNVIKKK